MARRSTKENKNIYQRTREGLGLTREEASVPQYDAYKESLQS